MTDLASPVQTRAHIASRRLSVWPILLAGPFAGLALGVLARLWMRGIAEDPDFTWSGTIAILISFTLFGTTQSIAIATRRRARRRWTLTIARVFGALGMMMLFAGAGVVMLPTVVCGGLAFYRTDWNRVVRWVCAAIASLPVLLVTKAILGFGWSFQTLVGVAGFLGIYGVIIIAARSTFSPQLDGWRLSRMIKIGVPALLCLPVVMMIAVRLLT